MDDKYFWRRATWDYMGDHLVVHDSFSPLAPRMITMEPWHEVVFLAAKGSWTFGEFVQHISAQYEGGAPAGLRDQLHAVLSDLLREGIVRVSSEAVVLPLYFAEQYCSASPEVRGSQVKADVLVAGRPWTRIPA
jgi:hypothetical protein